MTSILPWAERQWRRCPWVDSHTGEVSITRTIALFFAWKIGGIIDAEHIVTTNVLWLAIVTLAASFGKSTFTFALQRLQLKSLSAQVDTTSRETKGIIDRRNLDQGLEATP